MSALALALGCCSSPPSPVSLAWHAHLAGAVDGTPAVAGGMVIAGSAGGELAAFDAETGRELWRRRGLGPISDSPAVDGGHVFVGTLGGHVLAFRAADGLQLWDATGPPSAAFWSSPAVSRGVVVVGAGSPYGDTPLIPGRLLALDATTGREVWSSCVMAGCAPGGGVWSTAAIDAAGVAYIGTGNPDDGVIAFDPLTGARRWHLSLYADGGRDLDVGTRPVIVSAGGRELVEVGAVEGTFAALDASDGSIVWSRKVVDGSAVHGLIASPAFDGKTVYAASASPPNGPFALNAMTGDLVWRHATGLPVYSAPIVAHGAVAFGTGDVFGNLNAGSITAVSTAGGKVLWSFDTRSAVRSGPNVAGDLVFAGDYAGDLVALRVRSFS